VGAPLTTAGVASIDPALYSGKIQPILALPADAPAESAELWLDGLTFTVTTDPASSACYFGQQTTHELCPGGTAREVTLLNKAEYIELLSLWYQRTEAAAEIDAVVRAGLGRIVVLHHRPYTLYQIH
jgi:hypothetical protein